MRSGISRTKWAAQSCAYLPALLALLICDTVAAQSPTPRRSNTYQPVYSVDWSNGAGPPIVVQANAGDVAVVDDPIRPGRKAVRIAISRGEDFSHVVNGAPRAELEFPAPVRFAQRSDYLIRWSTWLPTDFAFDSRQLTIIMQIHQSASSGSPTIALTLLGAKYFFSERGGARPGAVSAAVSLCCADADRGKWVNWTLRYRPDETGRYASTELYKDGVPVFANRHAPNAYIGDQAAYLKIGLYKPRWKIYPSDVSQSTLFYGPVRVDQR